MDTLTIVIALIINLIAIYLIIASASKSNFIARHLMIQTNLLAKIAEKQGVSKEEIDTISKFKL